MVSQYELFKKSQALELKRANEKARNAEKPAGNSAVRQATNPAQSRAISSEPDRARGISEICKIAGCPGRAEIFQKAGLSVRQTVSFLFHEKLAAHEIGNDVSLIDHREIYENLNSHKHKIA